MTGSSPRLRGTPSARHAIGARRGSSPRLRGTRSNGASTAREPTGSSPRLRGTGDQASAGARAARFIPAPAGNRPAQLIARCDHAVHPRACGERERRAIERRPHGRFIPAPAGNALDRAALASMAVPVHPRACGEHRDAYGSRRTDGSSPRLRGTEAARRPRHASRRFIPAPAGNTRRRWRRRSTRRFIPAPAGNTRRRAASSQPPVGSSPRLRGTRAHASSHERCVRFIPAPAGNTAPRAPR